MGLFSGSGNDAAGSFHLTATTEDDGAWERLVASNPITPPSTSTPTIRYGTSMARRGSFFFATGQSSWSSSLMRTDTEAGRELTVPALSSGSARGAGDFSLMMTTRGTTGTCAGALSTT